jgi:glycosyltransferase involved in cell wall biosynthesis
MNSKVNNQAVCFLCSILDEKTKEQRGIVYDSPAATKKVFDVCHALQSKFKNVYVLTVARGQQRGGRKSFAATSKKISGLPVLYARFDPLPLLTYFVSAFSLITLVRRLLRQNNNRVLHLLVYNRNWLYVPCLVLARLFGARCYLDLEDGVLVETSRWLARIQYALLKYTFGNLCSHGSILVAPGLNSQVNTANNVVCYGVAQQAAHAGNLDWQNGTLRFLLGGTLMRETGVPLLMDAVRILNSNFQTYKYSFVILITGHGPLADELAQFSQTEGKGWIEYKGRVSKTEYEDLLLTSHIGLCLKLPSCEMGATTFPSKVIEIASQGKLVLTTKLGHVSNLFGSDGACFLEDENPQTLANVIISIVSNRNASMESAILGQHRVFVTCNAEKVADDICRLFEGNLAK